MWDTSKDYRLLIAQKSKDLYDRTINNGSFRGHWNKKMALESANNMNNDFQALTYSYLEPKDIAKSSEIESLIEKANDVIKYLGGDNWSHVFLDKAQKDEREKVEESIAKVRFFIRTILGLRERMNLGSISDPIIGIDIIVGEIMSVSKHPTAENLVISNVNIGKQAIKVVTNDITVKDGNHVGISMLPPLTFMGIASEGMFLGNNGRILKNVEGELGTIPKGIPIESLNETRNLVENFLKK
jgi:predicted RNA-binding protein with EMAP domain